MPKKILTVKVKLNVKEVSCPGTLHLTDRNHVFAVVALLGQLEQTGSVRASFPLQFNTTFRIKRTFTNARSLDTMMEILEDENVLIELRQYSKDYDDGRILANFSQNAREFLFPSPTFAAEHSSLREVLLERFCNFLPTRSLSPRLHFITKTTVKEESEFDDAFARHKNHRKGTKSKSQAESYYSGSDPSEEDIATQGSYLPNYENVNGGQRHCFCDCPHRPEKKLRSPRSLAVRKANTRPPFKVGKAPEELISKRKFDDPSPGKRKKKRRSLNAGRKFCSSCETPHPDCIVCDSYVKVYGDDFTRFRFEKPACKSKRKDTPHALLDSPHQALRLSSSPYNVPLVRARPPRDLSPVRNDQPRHFLVHSAPPRTRRRHGGISKDVNTDGNQSLNASVEERVKRLLKKNNPALLYNFEESTSESDEESSLDDFVSMQELRNSLNAERKGFSNPSAKPLQSVVVPLGGDEYWSTTKSRLSNRTHRQLFNDSLGSIYKDMYEKTRDGD